jgi:hypothetical protein
LKVVEVLASVFGSYRHNRGLELTLYRISNVKHRALLGLNGIISVIRPDGTHCVALVAWYNMHVQVVDGLRSCRAVGLNQIQAFGMHGTPDCLRDEQDRSRQMGRGVFVQGPQIGDVLTGDD